MRDGCVLYNDYHLNIETEKNVFQSAEFSISGAVK